MPMCVLFSEMTYDEGVLGLYNIQMNIVKMYRTLKKNKTHFVNGPDNCIYVCKWTLYVCMHA